jgi:hypothetical protein
MDESRWYWLLLGVLATWRVAHLLQFEEGPWHFLSRLRKATAPWLAGVLACFYCFSVWVALPAAMLLGRTWPERFWLWPALSAGAILLERLIAPPTPWYSEDPPKEDPHELLRSIEPQATSPPPAGAQPRERPLP